MLCARGQGDAQKQAPAIAGREKWYLEAQLRKFRVGVAELIPMMLMAESWHLSQTLQDRHHQCRCVSGNIGGL
ncbi:MAG: hypothetical protein ABF329_04280 [Lentimonas sp.]